MKKPKRPDTLAGVLDSLDKLDIPARLTEARLKDGWPRIVGAIAKRCTPERLMGSTLFCAVSSSAWMSELNYQKDLLKRKINSALGPGTVDKIVLRTGAVAEPPAEEKEEKPPEKRPVTKERKEFIEKTASTVEDPELREAIRRALEKAEERG